MPWVQTCWSFSLYQLPWPNACLGFKVPLCVLWHGSPSLCGSICDLGWFCMCCHISGRTAFSFCGLPLNSPWSPGVADAGRLCLFSQHSREGLLSPTVDCFLNLATEPVGGRHRQALSYCAALQGGDCFLLLWTVPLFHQQTQGWLPFSPGA